MLDNLVFLRGSPWSLMTGWALAVGGGKKDMTEFTPGPGTLWLRWRLGRLFSGEQVSVPVAFPADGGPALEGTWDITKKLAPSMLAADEPRQKEWFHCADVLCRHGRISSTNYDDDLVGNVAPWPLSSFKFLNNTIRSKIRAKYGEEDRRIGSEEAMKEALRAIDRSLAEHGCLVPAAQGKLTLADIAVATAVECYDPKYWYVGSHNMPKAVAATRPLIHAYPRIVAWRDRLFEEELPVDALRPFYGIPH